MEGGPLGERSGRAVWPRSVAGLRVHGDGEGPRARPSRLDAPPRPGRGVDQHFISIVEPGRAALAGRRQEGLGGRGRGGAGRHHGRPWPRRGSGGVGLEHFGRRFEIHCTGGALLPTFRVFHILSEGPNKRAKWRRFVLPAAAAARPARPRSRLAMRLAARQPAATPRPP